MLIRVPFLIELCAILKSVSEYFFIFFLINTCFGFFDIYFDTKFMAESDERDKIKYYKKGYLAYKRMLVCQLVLIVILFSSALYEDISPVIALIALIPCLVGILTNGFAGEKNYD